MIAIAMGGQTVSWACSSIGNVHRARQHHRFPADAQSRRQAALKRLEYKDLRGHCNGLPGYVQSGFREGGNYTEEGHRPGAARSGGEQQ
jgi:hypothetical protein